MNTFSAASSGRLAHASACACSAGGSYRRGLEHSGTALNAEPRSCATPSLQCALERLEWPHEVVNVHALGDPL